MASKKSKVTFSESIEEHPATPKPTESLPEGSRPSDGTNFDIPERRWDQTGVSWDLFISDLHLPMRSWLTVSVAVGIILFANLPSSAFDPALSFLLPVVAYVVSAGTGTIGGHLRNGLGNIVGNIFSGITIIVMICVFWHSDSQSMLLLAIFCSTFIIMYFLHFSNAPPSKPLCTAVTLIVLCIEWGNKGPDKTRSLVHFLEVAWLMQANNTLGVLIGWACIFFPWPYWTAATCQVQAGQEAFARSLTTAFESTIHCALAAHQSRFDFLSWRRAVDHEVEHLGRASERLDKLVGEMAWELPAPRWKRAVARTQKFTQKLLQQLRRIQAALHQIPDEQLAAANVDAGVSSAGPTAERDLEGPFAATVGGALFKLTDALDNALTTKMSLQTTWCGEENGSELTGAVLATGRKTDAAVATFTKATQKAQKKLMKALVKVRSLPQLEAQSKRISVLVVQWELVAAQLRGFCSETLNEELADPRSTFSDWLGEVPVSWDLKVLMPWSKLTWKHAFQSARVAVAAVATVAFLQNSMQLFSYASQKMLPKAVGWGAMTVGWVTRLGSDGATLKTVRDRFVGTATGCMVALGTILFMSCSAAAGDSLDVHDSARCQNQLNVGVTVLFGLWAGLGKYGETHPGPFNYAWLVFAVTPSVVSFDGWGVVSAGLINETVLARAFATFVGAGFTGIVAALLFPNRATPLLHKTAAAALAGFKNHFHGLISLYAGEQMLRQTQQPGGSSLQPPDLAPPVRAAPDPAAGAAGAAGAADAPASSVAQLRLAVRTQLGAQARVLGALPHEPRLWATAEPARAKQLFSAVAAAEGRLAGAMDNLGDILAHFISDNRGRGHFSGGGGGGGSGSNASEQMDVAAEAMCQLLRDLQGDITSTMDRVARAFSTNAVDLPEYYFIWLWRVSCLASCCYSDQGAQRSRRVSELQTTRAPGDEEAGEGDDQYRTSYADSWDGSVVDDDDDIDLESGQEEHNMQHIRNLQEENARLMRALDSRRAQFSSVVLQISKAVYAEVGNSQHQHQQHHKQLILDLESQRENSCSERAIALYATLSIVSECSQLLTTLLCAVDEYMAEAGLVDPSAEYKTELDTRLHKSVLINSRSMLFSSFGGRARKRSSVFASFGKWTGFSGKDSQTASNNFAATSSFKPGRTGLQQRMIDAAQHRKHASLAALE